jgi:hypothetical protein
VPSLDPTGMMSVEDGESKIRRNLVTTSFAIILLWFLEIPLSKYASEVLKDPTWAAPGWKVWFLLSAVLFYLALRYRFTEDHKAVTDALSDAYKNRLPGVVYDVVCRALKARGQTDTRQLGFDRSKILQEFADSAEPRIGTPARVIVTAVEWQKQDSPTNGVVNAKVSAQRGDGTRCDGDLSIEYDLVGWKLRRSQIEAWFFSWVYSREAVEYLVPCMLASLAIGITSYSLTTALRQLP